MLREQNINESVIVVLKDDKGFAPLRWALRNLVRSDDALLVIVILNAATSKTATAVHQLSCFPFVFSNPNERQQTCHNEGEEYMKFLHRLIIEKKEGHRKLLRPFYSRCKNIGVKFQAKVAAGFRPKEIAIEEANNAKATWIIMDRCLVKDSNLQLNCHNCSVALVNDEEEAELHCNLPSNCHNLVDRPEIATIAEESANPESPMLVSKYLSLEEPHIRDSMPVFQQLNRLFPASLCENLAEIEVPLDRDVANEKFCGKPENVLEKPMEIERTWEEIMEITDRFSAGNCIGKEGNAVVYRGILRNPAGLQVLVKRFSGSCEGKIKGEIRAASTLFHRNIMGLVGYHKSSTSPVLVYASAGKGSLDQYLSRVNGKPSGLTWPERMKIATETGRGFRYLHEECPQGPVVHGDLRPRNIILTHDFRPLISGFGRARWLRKNQTVATDACGSSKARSGQGNLSEEDLIAVKSDVFGFGVLLLRLFSRRPLMPEDDQELVEWARPLLLQRAFHELLDHNLEELDMYEIYKVMTAATFCTSINPHNRPGMNEVVSILRGEHSCVLQVSPLSERSLVK